jgi:hypothetical protein
MVREAIAEYPDRKLSGFWLGLVIATICVSSSFGGNTCAHAMTLSRGTAAVSEVFMLDAFIVV